MDYEMIAFALLHTDFERISTRERKLFREHVRMTTVNFFRQPGQILLGGSFLINSQKPTDITVQLQR
jgi:hypothetical protein